jgi:hypothetical protein
MEDILSTLGVLITLVWVWVKECFAVASLFCILRSRTICDNIAASSNKLTPVMSVGARSDRLLLVLTRIRDTCLNAIDQVLDSREYL